MTIYVTYLYTDTSDHGQVCKRLYVTDFFKRRFENFWGDLKTVRHPEFIFGAITESDRA